MPEPSPSSANAPAVTGSRIAWQDIAPLQLVTGCLRAAFELALARLFLVRLVPADIAARNRAVLAANRPAPPDANRCIDLVAALIPRVARRVPWRSDCLVQALAAQSWLSDWGMAPQIEIGIAATPDAGFSSHAWLCLEGHLVTGGDIAGYDAILGSNNHA